MAGASERQQKNELDNETDKEYRAESGDESFADCRPSSKDRAENSETFFRAAADWPVIGERGQSDVLNEFFSFFLSRRPNIYHKSLIQWTVSL